jgi:NAD(P)-dependent dehydrogenase (short-subunit alcohol dehydrogenase family)
MAPGNSSNGSLRGAVVVTGTSTGIGRATALRLDSMGFLVFAGVRRDEDAEGLSAEASGNLRPLRVDVLDPDSIRAAAAEVVRAAPDGLAGLVNNAGQSIPGPLECQPIDDFRRQIDVNLTGQVATIQAFLPQIRSARGRIVNVSSIGGRNVSPFLGAYSASKFAIEAVGDTLRLELAPWGIHVAAIEPGAVRTEIWRKGRDSGRQLVESLSPEARELYGARLESGFAVAERMERMSVPPGRVAKAIVHALTARRPRTRYLVGPDARLLAVLAKLPDRTGDAIKRRLAGI